jgi:hypothetical protein
MPPGRRKGAELLGFHATPGERDRMRDRHADWLSSHRYGRWLRTAKTGWGESEVLIENIVERVTDFGTCPGGCGSSRGLSGGSP